MQSEIQSLDAFGCSFIEFRYVLELSDDYNESLETICFAADLLNEQTGLHLGLSVISNDTNKIMTKVLLQ